MLNHPESHSDQPKSPILNDLCPNCQTTLTPGSHLCFLCGTPRANLGNGAPSDDHFPTFLSQPTASDPPGDPSSIRPLPTPRAASVYEFPRPKSPAIEEEQKPHAALRQRIALALLLVLGMSGTVVVWNRRQEGKALFATFRQTLDSEITQVMYGRADEHHNAEPPAAPAKASGKSHPRNEANVVVQVSQGPRTVARALAVRVDPESALRPVAARVTEYPSNSNVAVAIADSAATASTRALSPLRIQVSPRESLYLLLKQVSPVYPPAARAVGKQGAVVLKAVIGKDGLVHALESVSGDPILVPAAIDAVKKWQYRPYYRDGEPQEVETLIVLEFSLTEARAANQIR